MLSKFYKAKSFWKQGYDGNRGEYTDYDRHPYFSDDVYRSFKEEISSLHAGDLKEWNSEQVFVFQKIERKDFKGRAIPTTVVLYADSKFIDPKKISEILEQKITNVFDDTWIYEIDIDDTLIEKRFNTAKVKGIQSSKLWVIVLAALILLLMGLLTFVNKDNNTQSKNTKQPILIDTNEQTADMNAIKQRVQKSIQEVKKDTWIWQDFCQKNTFEEGASFCYQKYIKSKCDARFKFKLGYLDYAKKNSQGICFAPSKYNKISQDADLRHFIKKNKIKKKNLKFFEGEK